MDTHDEIYGLNDIETVNTAVDDLETEVVNLIFLGIDQSESMRAYHNDMVAALNEFKDALNDSKEADEILLARANFNNNSIDVGGYKKIPQFSTAYSTFGMTPLYDVVVEGAEKLVAYMNFLKDQGMRVKAVFAIFSDGDDTSSKSDFHAAKKNIESLNKLEITTAFISFGSEAKEVAENLRFQNALNVKSSASDLRKAFNVLSKSVIEASKSVVSKTDDFFAI